MSQVPSAQDRAPVPGGLNDYTCHIIPLSHVYLRPCQLRPPEHWALSLHSICLAGKHIAQEIIPVSGIHPESLPSLFGLGALKWNVRFPFGSKKLPSVIFQWATPSCTSGGPSPPGPSSKASQRVPYIDPPPWKHLWVYNSPTQAPSQSAGSLHPPWDREEGRKQMATHFQAQSEVGLSCF